MKIATLNLCLGLVILLHTLTLKAEEMIVVRGDEDYPPMEMVIDGIPTGFHVDVVNEVAKDMGITVQWKSVPWKRALSMIENGKADGITYISRNTKREKFAIFLDGNVLSSSTVNFFVLKEDADKYSFDGDIKKFIGDQSILKLRGFAFGNAIDTMPSYEMNTMEQIVKMLELRRYRIAVLNQTDFVGAMKGKHEYDSVVAVTPPVHDFKNYIAFSKTRGDDALAKRFESAYLAFKKTPRYDELVKKYAIVQ